MITASYKRQLARAIKAFARFVRFNMFLLLNFLMCLGGCVFAQQDFAQRCESRPLATPENFNVTRFLGVWYDSHQTFASISKCNFINLEKINDVEVAIEHMVYENGSVRVVLNSGIVNLGGRNQSMVLTSENSTNASLVVVGTDYDGYAVLWVCKNSNGNESRSQQQLWLWSRNYSLPATALSAINATIVDQNLTDFHNVSNLEGQVQCRFLQIGDGVSNNATTVGPATNVTQPSNGTAHNHTTHNGVRPRGPNCEFTALIMIMTMLFSAVIKNIYLHL